MSSIVQKAAAGSRAAMTQLYQNNSQKVWSIAKSLLGDKDSASDVTSRVFNNVLGSLASNSELADNDFADLLIQKTVNYCKKKILKQDVKAFNIPLNGDCSNAEASLPTDAISTADDVLSRMDALPKFVCVLMNACGFSAERVAKNLNTDADTVSKIADSAKGNIERIINAAGNDGRFTYASVIDRLTGGDKDIDLGSADTSVKELINKITSPDEKSASKGRKWIIWAAVAVCALAIVIAIISGLGKNNASADPDFGRAPSATTVELNPTHYADIEIKKYGTITVALDGNIAPETVENFVSLAESGFYDGLTFHRIIEGFMMQGGDPDGDGTGGSEKTIHGEFSANDFDNELGFTRGVIAMARTYSYDSASSQFFIMQEDYTEMNGLYASFGCVTEGMEIVDQICADAEPTDDNGTIASRKQPVIKSITIRKA